MECGRITRKIGKRFFADFELYESHFTLTFSNRYTGGSGGGSFGVKRGPVRRDDEPNMKRNRFDAASDTYEPLFNKRADAGARAMLTFKKFLETQDESISDDEAISKYNEYKLEYRKQEFEKFFAAHKDEEWLVLRQ